MCAKCARALEMHKSYVTYPAGFKMHISFFVYKSVFKNTLRGAKYFSVRSSLYELCKHIPTQAVKHNIKLLPSGSCFVPIPLHKKRLAERGFNQATCIADFFSKVSGIPVCENVLERVKYTSPQAQLPRADRLNNLQKAFVLSAKVGKTIPKNIILVDDVWTTGSTMIAAAKELQKNNVREIYAITLAR